MLQLPIARSHMSTKLGFWLCGADAAKCASPLVGANEKLKLQQPSRNKAQEYS
jgi:hypothetical protein